MSSLPPPVEGFGRRIRVVLVRPLKAGNVGMVARAMKNMGLGRLVLVNPHEDDPRQAAIMAPGAGDVLSDARRVATVEEAIEGVTLVVGTTVRGRRYRWPVLEPGLLAGQIHDTPGEVALLFGPEDSGLDNDTLLKCHLLCTIVTDRAPSLNLAQAVLVVAHHLFEEARRRGYEPPIRRHPSRRGHHDHPSSPAPPEEGAGERPADAGFVLDAAERAAVLLSRTAYLDGRSREQVRLTLFHLLSRANPSIREVSILLGMMAKVTWTLDHPGDRPEASGG
ncbi:MAG: RNA methyltransferase [Deltaproteobacteria bacterium]|nr:RNA methyltransferase [Deltaproteobacteria bacterium]